MTALRWVAANAGLIGDCRDGHMAVDDGLRGTLCGRIHGGTSTYAPTRPCGNCLRVARARHASALSSLLGANTNQEDDMDPDANLARQRELAAQVLTTDDVISYDERAAALDELAALVHSLDEWLTSGGFPPRAWNPTVHQAAGLAPAPYRGGA